MDYKLRLSLASILAVGGMSFGTSPQVRADDADATAGQNDASNAQKEVSKGGDQAEAASTVSFPAGVKLDDEPEEAREAVSKTLGSITEAAFTRDGFDDVVQRLVDQDRNRIGKDNFAEKEFADLNAKVDALRAAWKEKYGDDFELDGEDAFEKVALLVGKIDDPKAVASAWPVPAVSDGAPAADAVPAAAKETTGNDDPNLNSNVEKGRGVAIATIPASHGLPALNVSLIGELQGWRIDVPNPLTGQQLHDSLLKHLTHVSEMQAQWPADKKEAASLVAHHVLLAAYGVDVEPKGQEQKESQSPADADGGASDANANDADENAK